MENQAKIALLLWKNGDGFDELTLGKIAKCTTAHDGQRFIVQRGESGAFSEMVPVQAPVRRKAK